MLKKIKNWIIKKLGGYTSTEYAHVQNEVIITDKIHEVAVSNREIKTIKYVTSFPYYMERINFDVKKYALAGMVDKIIESGALHVTEFQNPRLCCTDVVVVLKIVV